MKKLLLMCMLLVCVGGCGQPNQPLNSCQQARKGLTIAVLSFNAIYSVDPNHFSPKDVNMVQKMVNVTSSCIDGLCLDPNNPTFQPCIDSGMKELNLAIYQSPVRITVTVPVEGVK